MCACVCTFIFNLALGHGYQYMGDGAVITESMASPPRPALSPTSLNQQKLHEYHMYDVLANVCVLAKSPFNYSSNSFFYL